LSPVAAMTSPKILSYQSPFINLTFFMSHL